jgi:Undecaprenyl-phosphate galactose phosphotransferase WbaP
MVLCDGPRGRTVIEKLWASPSCGLRPAIAVIDDLQTSAGDSIPTVCGFDLAPTLAKLHNIRHAIVVFSARPRTFDKTLQKLIREYLHVFPHIILMPEGLVGAPLWTTNRDVGGLVGLEVNQNLLLKGPQIIKRAIDFVTAVCLSVVVIPACILIAMAIRLTSSGAVFYGQRRIGRHGRPFTAWKFRTMMKDADRLLEEYLAGRSEARFEWARTQKLVNDPRITRVGKLLRRMSLDELPQLWNIFLGQMSLVGPRPIVASEVAKYGESFAYYCRVSPGLTGLWQVSGRNDTTYPERVAYDEYYVCNWSVWIDIYILLRTVKVLLTGEGAY